LINNNEIINWKTVINGDGCVESSRWNSAHIAASAPLIQVKGRADKRMTYDRGHNARKGYISQRAAPRTLSFLEWLDSQHTGNTNKLRKSPKRHRITSENLALAKNAEKKSEFARIAGKELFDHLFFSQNSWVNDCDHPVRPFSPSRPKTGKGQ